MHRSSAAARVGLFIIALALMAAGTAIAAPTTIWSAPSDAPAAGNAIANDDAGSPTDLLHLPFTTTTDTTGATLEIGETQPCGDIGATLWYLYRPSFARHVILDTEGSTFDTVLAVYSRTFSPPGGLDEIACNDNAQGGTTSGVALDVSPGFDYLIQVGGASGATGSLTLNVVADPPGGTVTGTITDNNAAPISGAVVLADNVVCCASGFAITQADGTYTLSDMLPGTYHIRANATGFVSEFYDGVFTFDEASSVVVGSGASQSSIDIQLGTGGGISGVVVDGNGVPLENVFVSASSFDCCGGNSTYSAADGTYTINQLAPGSYFVRADRFGYAPEYYDNVFDSDLAKLVPVADEATTPTINFALTQGASISGFVTDENGEPLVGASVYGGRNGSCCGDGYANTGIDGSYTLTGLAPGDYRVFVEAFGYPPKYYVDAFDYYAATEVSVADGQAVTDINVQMTPGGSIAGVVTDGNGTPIENAFVVAQSYSCCYSFGATTGPGGAYVIQDIAPGSYYVRASAPGVSTELWNNVFSYSDASLVVVSSGNQSSGIDFALDPGGSISGVVTNDNGDPIAGAYVYAEPAECCVASYGSDVTQADGSYTMADLAPVEYVVHAEADGFAGEYFDDTYDFGAAMHVQVQPGTDTPGVNFELAEQARISGRVTDSNGDPIPNAYVYANSEICCASGGGASTDANGDYVIVGLAPGSYRVYSEAFGFVGEYYDDVQDYDLATLVSVGAGQEASDVNFALAAAGAISGLVTDANGDPIAGAHVVAERDSCCGYGNAITDGNGAYVIENLRPANYRVSVSASGYAGEFFENVYEYDAATFVAVASGVTTPDIDFELAMGGSISGVVRDENGDPIAGAAVQAGRSVCCAFGFGFSNPSGTYTIPDLPPGDYIVGVHADSYSFEFFDNVTNYGDATPVHVDLGDTTPAIDFALAEEARISGRVTDANGNPIANAYVYANSEVCCTSGGYDYTDGNGDYTLVGLAAGSYRVYSEAFGFVGEYYEDVHDYDLATLVTVGAGHEATDIDFALEQAGAISGVVTNANGDPIAGAYVAAEQDACCGYGDAYTNGNGAYTIENLPSGGYLVRTSATGFAGEYFDNVFDSNAATLVAVTSGDTTPDIDFSLDVGGSISGVVRNDDGEPIPGAEVDASSVGCCAFGYTYTDTSGAYTIPDLPPGDYIVQAFAGGYVYEFFDNVTNYNAATQVHVDLGSDTPGIDFALAPPDPDSAAGAKNIDSLPFTDARDTSGAGLEEGEPQPCGDIGATIWYRFLAPTSPPFNGGLKFDTTGSDFDTIIAVYTNLNFATSPPGGSTLLDCTDDGDGGLEFPVEAGNLYYIQVGGNDGATGNLVVHVTCPGDADCDGQPDEGGPTPTATQTSPDTTATPTEGVEEDTPTPSPTDVSEEDTPTPTPTEIAETPVAGPGTGTVEATSTSGVTTTPEVTHTAESTPDVTPTSPAGESATPESTPESTPDPTVTEPATEEPTLTATSTATPSPTSTNAPPTVTKTHTSRTHTPSPTRTSQSTPQPSATAPTSVATPPRSSTAAPISDVLGTQQRPILLPNTGAGSGRSSSSAVMWIGPVGAALLLGGMLISARRRGSRRR